MLAAAEPVSLVMDRNRTAGLDSSTATILQIIEVHFDSSMNELDYRVYWEIVGMGCFS